MPSNDPMHNGVATPPQRREVVVVLVGKYGANANTCACSDMLNAITIIIKIVKIILFPMDTKVKLFAFIFFSLYLQVLMTRSMITFTSWYSTVIMTLHYRRSRGLTR